jgi:myo-inositol-1(or 4)-monophosphatase
MISEKYKEIIRAAKAGGEVAKKYFGKSLKLEDKTIPADFRTKADLESEKAILKILEKEFPDYNIFSEEAGELNKNSEYTFIVDPLDGTNNFVLGIPYFSVGIGLMKGTETIFGVVYNPILDNLYFAEKERGAFLNQKKICVNNEEDIRNSSICVVVDYGDKTGLQKKLVIELNSMGVKRCLTNWSCLLDFCLLASGKIESIIFHNCPLHDFVPGKLIAKEAGAVITDFDGNKEENHKNNTFLTSNGTKIHREILEVLK